MGFFDRMRRTSPARRYVTPPRLPMLAAEPAWLPGSVEVQVRGESRHLEAIRAATWGAQPDALLVAVLVPEPSNPHDPRAVAVYVQGRHVGYLPANIAAQVQSPLLAFSAASGGRMVSCQAVVREHAVGPQVVLMLDPGPLGVHPGVFEVVPELARVLSGLLSRLDMPAPMLGGVDERARAALAAAAQACDEVEANYDRGPRAWPRVERALRAAVDQLSRAADPMVAVAWLNLARAIRYQRGRRDDTLEAYIEALHCDRGNSQAWSELVEYAAAAPHIPTLIGLFKRAPFASRPALARQLLAISRGADRLGNMSLAAGERLRADLLDVAYGQGDADTVAFICGDAGLRAHKDGDLDTAVAEWRRAITAGSTDVKVVERFSLWLIKQGEYAEAAQVLRQALEAQPLGATIRERLEKRLARCKKALPPQA